MFQGITELRSEGQSVEYTKALIDEYIKCKEDIIYFAEKYFYITTIDKGKILVPLLDFQKKVLKAFIETPEDKRHIIMMSPRQQYKTTTFTIYLVHYILFNSDKNVAIIANKEKTAIEIMRRIKLAYKMLPIWLQQGIIDGGWNKSSIQLENGIRVIASTTSSDSISGEAIALLYMDEFSKVKSHIAEEFITATYPVISSGKTSKIIITSCVVDDTSVFTPNGIKEISDFIDYKKSEHSVLGYEVDKYSIMGKDDLNDGNVVVNNGKAVTNIITSPSSKLECSKQHMLWACKNGKYDWYKSSELFNKDYVSIKYDMDLWGSNNNISFDKEYSKKNKNIYNIKIITEDFAYFLGLYISEGSIYKSYSKKTNNFISGMITLTCGDDLEFILKKLGFKYYYGDGIHYSITSKYLVELFEYLGFDTTKHANEKIIPKRLFEMSKNNMIALVQGIMDGDGSSQINKGTVCISLSSKKLIEQLRMIFLNFGILTMYGSGITKPTNRVKVESKYFRISLNKTMSKKYYDIIGFRFKRKQLKEKYLPRNITRDRFDLIPFSKDIIFNLKYTHMDDYKKIIKSGILKGNYKQNHHFSRMFMLRHKQFMLSLNNEKINKLYENISKDIKWECIKSITKSENKVYDFSLKDINNNKWCHSIIYNGIIGHQTPLGLNHFYEFWINAVRGKNNFFPIRINWWEHPDRDEKWKEDTIKDIGEARFNQEYGCRFLGSSNTLIDPDILERIVVKEPIEYKWNGLFKIYEKPQEGALYILGIDTAKGTGRDSSVIQVLKIESEHNIKQVAVYKNNKIDTHEYAQVCISISKFYNNAFMMIENNGEGGETASVIWYEYEYDYVINCDKKGIGIRSTKKSKLNANLVVKRYLENKWLELSDNDTLVELSKYIEMTPNVFKAETRTTNDDCVTGLIWGMYFLITQYFDGKDLSVKKVEEKYNLEEEIPIIYYNGDDNII